MQDSDDVFVINSEEDAVSLLRRALNNEVKSDATPIIKFGRWPSLDIYLPETRLEGSINASLMTGIIDYQNAIYRVHLLLSEGTTDLRVLSEAERKQYEFPVRGRALN